MQSDNYPITIEVKGLSASTATYYLVEPSSDKQIRHTLTEGGTITIANPDVKMLRLEKEEAVPLVFGLEQNYPNPFNPTTGVRFQVPGISWVRLVVYDLLGREVAVLVDELKQPGRYQVTFDAAGLASGLYMYRLTAGEQTAIRKMVYVK